MTMVSTVKKIALSGATGFIGSHILRNLEDKPVEVIAITRLGKDNLPKYKNVEWLNLDICSLEDGIYEKIGCPDVLIHAAWGGLPNYKSLHHFEVELPLQYTFLKKLILEGLSSVVVTGTCFEYGMKSGLLSENMDVKPTNPYGFAKDSLRRQLEYLQTDYTFDLTWARLFFLYGDGQSPSSLWSQFNATLDSGEKTFNMSAGEQLRDFLPVQTVAKKLVSLAMLQKNIGIVNICSGEPVSLRRLVETWINESNCEVEQNLGYYPYPDHEPMAFWGDNVKLCSLLD